MRLYTRTGATALDDPDYGHFEADENGGFNLPDPLAAREYGFAVRGVPIWETDIERQHRLIAEEIERRKDPATLLGMVEQLVHAQGAAAKAPAETPAPAKRAAKRAAAAETAK